MSIILSNTHSREPSLAAPGKTALHTRHILITGLRVSNYDPSNSTESQSLSSQRLLVTQMTIQTSGVIIP